MYAGKQVFYQLRHMASHCYDFLLTFMLYSLMKNGVDILIPKNKRGPMRWHNG